MTPKTILVAVELTTGEVTFVVALRELRAQWGRVEATRGNEGEAWKKASEAFEYQRQRLHQLLEEIGRRPLPPELCK